MGSTQSGAITQGQSEPGSEGNEGVLHVPQSSSNLTIRLFNVISWTLAGSYPSADFQSVYSLAQPTGQGILCVH